MEDALMTVEQISKMLGYDYDGLTKEQKLELEEQCYQAYVNAYDEEPQKIEEIEE